MKNTNKKMKRFSKLFGIIAVTAVIVSVLAGCVSYSVQSVVISAASNATQIKAGETLQFSFNVEASGKDTSKSQVVKWNVSSTADGKGPVISGTGINSGGLLTVSANEIYPVLYVTASHAVFSSQKDQKQIQVSGPKVGSVVLSTTASSVVVGKTVKLSAFVAGLPPNQGLTYSVGSKNDGTGAVTAGTSIAADGMLTVAAGEKNTSLWVRAVSNSDRTKFDVKEIKIISVTSVTVSAEGGTARVLRGAKLKFSAAVVGTNNPGTGVTWKVASKNDGTGDVTAGTAIASDGTLTVASTEAAATLYVIATSSVDTTKSGSIAVVIPTVTSVTVTPANPQVKRGDGATFRARVAGTGDPSQDVTWKMDGIGGTTSVTTMTSNGTIVISTAETLSQLLVTATSVDDPSKSGTTIITIPAVPAAIVPAEPAAQTTAPAASTSATVATPAAATPSASTSASAATTSTAATAIAPPPSPYIILKNSVGLFTVTRDGTGLGVYGATSATPLPMKLSDAISAIIYHDKSGTIHIQFGDGKTPLDIGDEELGIRRITKNLITLSGKITGISGPIISVVGDKININSTAEITHTNPKGNGSGIFFNSSGTLNITGGKIYSTCVGVANDDKGTINFSGGTIEAPCGLQNGNDICTINITGGTIKCIPFTDSYISLGYNSIPRGVYNNAGGGYRGKVNISGGTIDAGTIGVALYGYGPYYISGNAVITSANPNPQQGTAYFEGNHSGTNTVWIEMTGGTLRNTSATGNAFYTNIAQTFNFTGGTISAQANGYAIFFEPNREKVLPKINTTGAKITGKVFTRTLSTEDPDFDIYILDNNRVIITKYKKSATEIIIPEAIKGLPVTEIGEEVFQKRATLTSVTIPNTVKKIGKSAFSQCPKLTNVTIPDGVTTIGDYAFFGCTSFTSVIIPNSVTSIGSLAFYNCTGLTSITIGSGIKILKGFDNCTGLKSVTIPNTVTIIYGAFSGCTGLTSITIPNTVTGLEEAAFSGCTGLTSITIPSSITKIGNNAFSGCTGLTSITIPRNITSIGYNAFKGCTGLTSVTIPNTVTSIGSSAFGDGCTNLTSVTFQGTIPLDNFGGYSNSTDYSPFDGDLKKKFYATNANIGMPGTYTTTAPVGKNSVWTKQ